MNRLLLGAALLAPLLLVAHPQAGRVEEGAAVPALTAREVDGTAFDLASLRGRTVCIVFHDADTRYGAQAVADLARGFGEEAELVPLTSIVLILSGEGAVPAEAAALRETGFDVHVLRPETRAIQDRFSVVAFPTAFVVTPRGQVLRIVRGYSFRFAFRVLNACLHAAGLGAPDDHELPAGRTVDADTARALRLATRLLRSGDTTSAGRALSRPLEEGAPESPTLLAALTHVALLASDTDGARGWLEKLQQLDPSAPRTRVLAGRLALLEDRLPDAERILLELGRTGPESSLLHGLVAEFRQDWRRAAEAYREAVEEELFLAIPETGGR